MLGIGDSPGADGAAKPAAARAADLDPADQPLASVQLDITQIQTALETSAEFFIEFFHGEEIVRQTRRGQAAAVPEIHIDMFKAMTALDHEQTVIAIPRGHAKTTIAKLSCVYAFLFTPYSFAVYLSCTHSIAVPCVNDIIGYMESDNFRAVYGPLEWIVRRDGEGLYKFRLPWINKTCTLAAMGAGQQIRGLNIKHQRPDIAYIDDLESVDPKSGNILTLEQLEALKRWLYGSFIKALARQHRIIQIGNLLQTQSILYEHLQSPDWQSRLFGCLRSNGEPLWPEEWPLEALRADYAKYERMGLTDLWMAEMMNAPTQGQRRVIRGDQIAFRPARLVGEAAYGFVSLDLAASDNPWSHKTALAATGWYEDSQLWQVVEHIAWDGIDPIELFKQVAEMMHRWRFHVCGIESVAFQAVLAPIYTFFAEMTGNQHLQFLPVKIGQRAKAQRIISLAGLLKEDGTHTPSYALTEGDMVAKQQLLDFNPMSKTNDDDTIDAIAHGMLLIDSNIVEIMEQPRLLSSLPKHPIFTTYQTCPL